MISFSCETPDSSPQVIGFTQDENGKTDVLAGPNEINEIWETYIDAHNSRDLDAIRQLNAEGFTAYGPLGQVIQGSDEHVAFLSDWFETNGPEWSITWAISNTGENVNGEISDFVTAGHRMTLNVDGNDVTVFQVIDAMISNGKIVTFNVFEQQRGEASSE